MEFRFAHPALLMLVTLPFLPYLWRMWFMAPRPIFVYSDLRLMENLPKSWRVRLRLLPDILRAVVWGLLVIAVARPQSGVGEEIIRGEGVDIVIALDISSSMAALDFEPQNRLESAKDVIAEFINLREFDRIGLVVFAREAYHQAPLTLDYAVLVRILEDIRLISQLAPGQNQLDGTAIGLGIASATNMLRQSNASSRIIILMTDGDSNAGLDPITAAEIANALNIRIYTIGVGRDGEVPVPTLQGGTVLMESDFNEEVLQNIAQIGNGLYFRAEDTRGLQEIYNQIDRLERSNVERRVFVRWQDQAIWFILPALLMLLVEIILRETVFQVVP